MSVGAVSAELVQSAVGLESIGVKKSPVGTRQRLGGIRWTAASSGPAVATSTLGSTIGGSAPSTCPSSTGLSLQAQPAPWLDAVNRSGETGSIGVLSIVRGNFASPSGASRHLPINGEDRAGVRCDRAARWDRDRRGLLTRRARGGDQDTRGDGGAGPSLRFGETRSCRRRHAAQRAHLQRAGGDRGGATEGKAERRDAARRAGRAVGDGAFLAGT